MAEKKQPEPKKGLPGWMGTYGDLVTLLLCFFILLFAMSTVDAAKFEAMATSFNPNITIIESGGSDGLSDAVGSGIDSLPNVDRSINDSKENYKKMQEQLNQMASEFKTYFAENNFSQSVEVNVVDDMIQISFKDGILFDSGKATLNENSKTALDGVIEQLGQYPNSTIKVEGHTDDRPINTPQFPSNMYLSAGRAIAVYEYFIAEGIAKGRMSAEGFAENKPIAPNDTPENRAKNRRVEIYVKPSPLDMIEESEKEDIEEEPEIIVEPIRIDG